MGDHPFIAHRAYILMIDMKGRKVRGWTDLVLRQAASRFLDECRRKGEARDTWVSYLILGHCIIIFFLVASTDGLKK